MMPVAVNGKSRIALQSILFATDFSSASEQALGYALGIARRYDAKMLLAHVIRPDVYQLVPPEALTVTAEHARRFAEQQMSRLLVSGRLRGIPHQVLLGTGELWPVLSEFLEKHEVDLIVVGTHGRTGVRKLLLGSVAEEIFRLAPCPVLTVGPHAAPPAPSENGGAGVLRRILLATDFTLHSARAAAYAFSLAQEHMARLALLHVVQETPERLPQNQARVQEFFQRRMAELLPPEADLWCQPEFLLEHGSPADVILRVAGSEPPDSRADLIVLGVRKAANFPGHLPPATAYKVVCQAPCPVLTIRG
jgi:nucleotide-binding universal stress UspA family protein